MSHMSLAQSALSPVGADVEMAHWYAFDNNNSACDFIPSADSGSFLVMFSCEPDLSRLAVLFDYLGEQNLKASHWCMYRPVDAMTPALCLYSPDELNAEHDKLALQTFARKLDCELALVSKPPHLNEPGLLVMDMDSTAIRIECIDEIARLADVYDEVAAVTAAAMNGALDFAESLRLRVAKLAGIPLELVEQLKLDLPLMPGVEELCRVLKQNGWHLSIASGGFVPFAERVQQLLALDAIHANTLEDDGLALTGKVLGKIVDAEEKARFLKTYADELGICKRQTLAIGDGANDLKMMQAAGLGVAIHGKEKVVAAAPVAISQGSLNQILYLLTLPVALKKSV